MTTAVLEMRPKIIKIPEIGQNVSNDLRIIRGVGTDMNTPDWSGQSIRKIILETWPEMINSK